MERCPGCRARVRQNSQCPRCGTELSILLLIERQAHYQFACSINSYRQQQLPQAVTGVARAIALHRHPVYLHWQQFLLQRQGDPRRGPLAIGIVA